MRSSTVKNFWLANSEYESRYRDAIYRVSTWVLTSNKIIFILLIQQASFFMGAVCWNEDIALSIGAASYPFSSLRDAQGTGII